MRAACVRVIGAGIAVLIASAEHSGGQARRGTVAIVNTTVIDVITGGERPRVTIVTDADRIVRIGRNIEAPRGANTVDGAGKYVIPGLWDMHSHNEGAGVDSLDLYIAHGVVGTRDMGSAEDVILPLRDRIRRGELRGPEIVAAGPMLDNAPPHWPFRRTVVDARQAREAVRDLKARGVDLIKVHNQTPREVFFAIAEEAPKVGLPFAGHIPLAVTVAEGVAAGIQSIEHLSEFRLFRECAGKPQPYDLEQCRPLFDRITAAGIWQTPTIGFYRSLADTFAGRPPPHAEYMTDADIEFMKMNIAESKIDEKAMAFLRSMGETSLTVIRDMLTHGNRFLAGCDGGVPGFCLHDEMAALTEAGLTPLQAIQAATINPARMLGREQTQGTIGEGRRADMVVLDADPRLDIRNTTRISAVVVRGQLLQKPEIDRTIAARRRNP